MTRRQIDRDRHLRLSFYVALSLALSIFGYLFMEFDRLHALGFGVTAFVLLNLLNYRVVLARVEPQRRAKPHQN